MKLLWRRTHQESQVPRIIFKASRSGCPRLDSQCEEKADPYLFEIVAVMPANRVGGFRDLVIATSLELPTLDNVEEFHSLGMKYALDNKSQLGLGSGDNLNLYSVIVSDKLSDDVKRSISAIATGGSSMHGSSMDGRVGP